jgi:hypothetical protein
LKFLKAKLALQAEAKQKNALLVREDYESKKSQKELNSFKVFIIFKLLLLKDNLK